PASHRPASLCRSRGAAPQSERKRSVFHRSKKPARLACPAWRPTEQLQRVMSLKSKASNEAARPEAWQAEWQQCQLPTSLSLASARTAANSREALAIAA